ncbi:MAG: carbohydrate kinase family protein [Candidatus Zambryskibacteria bacterium]|nr:carbohydrate kinase family protein [Candidatus Zambryskibacteria bacterium]
MYDFIAIGDTATDIFIRLGDDSRALVTGTPGTPEYRISLPFAEKLPYEDATVCAGVGNAPNAAIAAVLLGLRSNLVAHIGDDQLGQETIEFFKKNGIDSSFVVPEPGKKTNYSYILWYKQDRTIFRKHEDFSYSLPNIGTPGWIYLSAVGSGVGQFYEEFADFIEENLKIKFAFQPAGDEVGLGTKLLRYYKRADIFFCNVEEAGVILGVETLGIQELLKRTKDLGPKIVVVTDGPRGAYAYDGEKIYHQLPYPDPKPPLERTGAGDAFSSTTVVALALGLDLPTALKWGAINAMSVVQHIGAQKGLLNREKIEEYLKNAPSEFQTKITKA